MITSHAKFAIVGFSSFAALAIGLVGCDSTPTPPTDVPPSVPTDIAPSGTKAGSKAAKSIKNRPGPGAEPTPASPTP